MHVYRIGCQHINVCVCVSRLHICYQNGSYLVTQHAAFFRIASDDVSVSRGDVAYWFTSDELPGTTQCPACYCLPCCATMKSAFHILAASDSEVVSLSSSVDACMEQCTGFYKVNLRLYVDEPLCKQTLINHIYSHCDRAWVLKTRCCVEVTKCAAFLVCSIWLFF